jgi:hypothetical protein
MPWWAAGKGGAGTSRWSFADKILLMCTVCKPALNALAKGPLSQECPLLARA